MCSTGQESFFSDHTIAQVTATDSATVSVKKSEKKALCDSIRQK